MATYKCTETDIRSLFLDSHDDPAPVFESCPESCEFLFGTKAPQLFDIHQGLFIQGILTLLFSAPYLLAFCLSSSSGRRKLRRLFNGFFVLQLALNVPTLLIATASLFDVSVREAGEEEEPARNLLNNGGVLPSIPDLLVADAAVQLQIFATAVVWCTLWLRYVLDSYDSDARRAQKKAADSDSSSSCSSNSDGDSSTTNRLRAFRLSPHRSNKQRARHTSDRESHKGFFIVVITLTASLMVTGVFGPWYLFQRLYHISGPNVTLAIELCGPKYAGLAVDPVKIDAVPSAAHVLILSLLLLGVLAVSVFDQSARRCRLIMAAGLTITCAFAHGFVLSSMVSLSKIRAALVGVLGDAAGVGNVTSAARVLAVVVWVPVVIGLLAWFWRAMVVASGLCPTFITKKLPRTPHPPSSLWRFNPRAKSLADRFRLLAPDNDDNIFGGHLAAYDPSPSQEHIHLGQYNKGGTDGCAAQMPRGPPKVFSGIHNPWRRKAGDGMKPAVARPESQHQPMDQRELQDMHAATMGVPTIGISSRGLPMHASTTWV